MICYHRKENPKINVYFIQLLIIQYSFTRVCYSCKGQTLEREYWGNIKQKLFMKKLSILFFLIFISCNPIEKRGYAFELSDYEKLTEEISDKNDVLNFMGYPIFVSEVKDNEIWVYYSEDVKKVLFFRPEILDRQVMAITFDSQNVISKISNYDLDDQSDISFSQKYTEVKSQKKSWWSQIFGNIGQVKAN
ncbi:MAG: outer membrane protein assembly factor BamE (lipoprotein component of BamABCDE complex) [Myxococcota bacterium]|jgi:outer membrane protein assembly factor BamE (lipoprotein component of BamABCDE complex)